VVTDLATQLTMEAHIWAKGSQTYALKNRYVLPDPAGPNYTTHWIGENDARPDLTFGRNFQSK
jgi:hypothetical protein